MTACTKTLDEQDPENPYKPFPKKQYIWHTLNLLRAEPIIAIEKSRTMMISWTVSAHCAHRMFTRPATGVIFQSEDEDRAVHDVDYVKTLWEHSLPSLKKRWKTRKGKDPHDQPYNYFALANGSWCLGLPGSPDKIRSEHPTIYVLDEAAHVEEGQEAWNVALAAKPLQAIALSSAKPGWFQDMTEMASPVDWPYAAYSE